MDEEEASKFEKVNACSVVDLVLLATSLPLNQPPNTYIDSLVANLVVLSGTVVCEDNAFMSIKTIIKVTINVIIKNKGKKPAQRDDNNERKSRNRNRNRNRQHKHQHGG